MISSRNLQVLLYRILKSIYSSSSPNYRVLEMASRMLYRSFVNFKQMQSPFLRFQSVPKPFGSYISISPLVESKSPIINPNAIAFLRFVTSASESKSTVKTEKKINTKVNFSLSDSDSDSDTDDSLTTKEIENPKLPPPYDPFNKKPAIEDPEDPSDLQSIFHKMRTEGLTNNAVKMFDGLSKDGLTHEALELFAQIKDKGHMPDVVAHTAVVEAYAEAGQPKEALKVFLRMLASGVSPNQYSYSVLIKVLCRDAKFLGEAKKYLMEMIGKGMKPNASTYTGVFEAFVRDGKAEEAVEFLRRITEKGFVAEEKAVREVIGVKRGQVLRSVLNILSSK